MTGPGDPGASEAAGDGRRPGGDQPEGSWSLCFLGPSSAGAAPPLLCEGAPLEPGQSVPLVHRRSPWRADGSVRRVILGSHPSRADVRLEAPDLRPEHLRIYLTLSPATAKTGAPPVERALAERLPAARPLVEVRPLAGAAVRVNRRALEELEWRRLEGGEEIQLGSWRFRLEPT